MSSTPVALAGGLDLPEAGGAQHAVPTTASASRTTAACAVSRCRVRCASHAAASGSVSCGPAISPARDEASTPTGVACASSGRCARASRTSCCAAATPCTPRAHGGVGDRARRKEVARHRRPGEEQGRGDLAEYRGQYAYNMLDANLKALLAEVPVVNQWDDHEVRNNWYPGQSSTTPDTPRRTSTCSRPDPVRRSSSGSRSRPAGYTGSWVTARCWTSSCWTCARALR
jgi:PhoD-like phosphatase